MRANTPKQRRLALWYPMAGVVLQLLLVMEEVLSFDPPFGSRYMTSQSAGQEGRLLLYFYRHNRSTLFLGAI